MPIPPTRRTPLTASRPPLNAALLLGLLILSGCGDSPAAVAPPVVPSAPTVVPAPTSWAIRGQVLAAPAGAPIEGASVRFGDAPPIGTDTGGAFSIETTDGSTKPLVISAPGYLTRETSLTGGEARSGVRFDLIGDEPGFPRTQFLHLVRNAFESPSRHQPSRRWTTNPNVYISTKWRDSAQMVSPESIEFFISEIRRLVPQWTAGTLQAGTFETGYGARPRTKGWISIEFGRSGNWSLLGEDPGQVQFGTEGQCQSLAIAHEIGHALGYWHSSVKPSIMGGGPGSCTRYDLTPNEALITRVMYSREPGNLEPDADGPPPPPAAYTTMQTAAASSSSGRAVGCDALLKR